MTELQTNNSISSFQRIGQTYIHFTSRLSLMVPRSLISKATIWGSAANRSLVSQETFPTTTWLANAFNSVTYETKDKMLDEAAEDCLSAISGWAKWWAIHLKSDVCKYRINYPLAMWGTNLDREVLIDKWHKHNLLIVPLLLSIDLHFASKPPALPAIPDQHLNKQRRVTKPPPSGITLKVLWIVTASTVC